MLLAPGLRTSGCQIRTMYVETVKMASKTLLASPVITTNNLCLKLNGAHSQQRALNVDAILLMINYDISAIS
jgi:hypothetical protein